MHIRPFIPADVEGMHVLHTAAVTRTCVPYYSAEEVEGWLRNRSPQGYQEGADKGENFLIAEENGQMQGFASWRGTELMSLFVHPDQGGKGIGKSLFEACENEVRKAHASPITHLNASLMARTFYMKLGFEVESLGFMDRGNIMVPQFKMRRKIGA